jgi:hypothetical protein
VADTKPPIVIEMSTNLRTGVTSILGGSAVPCPECKSRKTTVEGGNIVCKEVGCEKTSKLG